MLIDLHCHTLRVKKGENRSRTVSPELFREKIELAEVKIVAITNHNMFDFEQFVKLKDAVSDICQVWPGVEIDTIGLSEKDKYHLLVISNPDEVNSFDEHVKKIFKNEDVNSSVHTIKEVCTEFKNSDVIYIAHYHNKRPAITPEDRELLIDVVGDSARVFLEPSNYRSLGVLANKNLSVMIGSDVKNWSDYEKCSFAELRLPIGSFPEFLLLAKRDTEVVKTLLYKKVPSKLLCKPHSSVELELEIYPDINIIFGPKGTGKSEIIRTLYESMLAEGKRCTKYVASERSEEFSSLLSVGGEEQNASVCVNDLCLEDFSHIKNWNDSTPTSFERYKEWMETNSNSNNKARMKITEALHETYIPNKNYEYHKSDKEDIAKIVEKLQKMDLPGYIDSADAETLIRIITSLSEIVSNARLKDIIDENSVHLTNFTIDRIKSLADAVSDTVSKPSTLGLIQYAHGRLKLLESVDHILEALEREEQNRKNYLGTIENKGKLYINTRYRMLCKESKTDEFKGYRIRALSEIKKKLERIKSEIFNDNLAVIVADFNELCDNHKVDSIRPFIGISKQIVTEDGCLYEPSNGEKGILLLQRKLQEDADAYLLDEPELGMGGSFVNSDILPTIVSLSKKRKYVVVATHNANIAVRTLPYMSIYRTHENGKYRTYTGNPFDDKLINIDDINDVLSWSEECMHSLEGGKDAFYERKEIYESKDN